MTRALAYNPVLQKRIAFALISAALLLFGLYIYLLSASVMHVVVRTEINHQVREMTSQISLLESEFIAAQHAVSQNIAYLEGYERVHEKVFVDRSAPSLVLNTEEQTR